MRSPWDPAKLLQRRYSRIQSLAQTIYPQLSRKGKRREDKGRSPRVTCVHRALTRTSSVMNPPWDASGLWLEMHTWGIWGAHSYASMGLREARMPLLTDRVPLLFGHRIISAFCCFPFENDCFSSSVQFTFVYLLTLGCRATSR